ncbi:MAG TPA: hypothetical protein VL309_11325 [Vicinamibacterales bacterium]|nr:hypothetical protein [Vicinamibacterales bacterium]
MNRGRFDTLARAFFAQFFVSEQGLSDDEHRKAMCGVMAFLITPGFLIPFQLSGAFELAYLRFPDMVEPLTRLLATIFLTYSIVAVGVVAALVWDGLSFDRRDAMVLGPLPVPGPLVVRAKLAAMAVLLVLLATGVNVITALPFAAVASSHKTAAAFGRHMAAHMVATTCAVTFIFATLVTVRAFLSLLRAGQAALASLLRFALISGLLCFTVLTPTALRVTFQRVPGHRPAAHFQLAAIPPWSPTNWFLGLYEVVRGTADSGYAHSARIAIWATLLAVAAAVLTTMWGYRRQLQIALASRARRREHEPAPARAAAALARMLAGRSPAARGAAEFFVRTLIRNRPQQTPIAFNAAIGSALLVTGLLRTHAGIAAFTTPRVATLSIPLMLAYWVLVGLRTACFIPGDVEAGWVVRVGSATGTGALRRAACAALTALVVVPATLLAAAVTVPMGDPIVVARHTVFTLLVVMLMVEILTLTITFVPFTQPYRPGHAKVRALWPAYAVGALLCTVAAVKIEKWAWTDPDSFRTLLLIVAAAIVALDLAASRRGRGWSVHSREELADDSRDIAVLDIGSVVHGAHVGG